MATGTDFEALPFFRIDKTTPNLTRVDVPLLLTTVDTWPHEPAADTHAKRDGTGASCPPSGEASVAEELERPAEEAEPEDDYYVRALWPLGIFQKRGSHLNWSMAFVGGAEGGDLANSGPAGRLASSEDGVSDDAFASLAEDPVSGGISALSLLFTRTVTDHGDFPDSEGAGRDEDINLWPFVLWGSGDSEEDDYLAIAPFGGTTRGLLGKEKITWFGYPYPIYAAVTDRSYTSHHVLFPLINWIDGPHNSGFRIFPLFGHYERTTLKGDPVYEKTWLLWPLLSWATTGMNEEEPTHSFFLFPFYGHILGPSVTSYTVLWPFFKYEERRGSSQTRLGNWNIGAAGGADLTGDEDVTWELRAPFPFLTIAGGRDQFQFDLWPLFGYRERPGYVRNFVLWPFWRYEDMESGDKHFTGQWLLPLFWRTKWTDHEAGTTEHRWRLYPLLHYRNTHAGTVDVSFPSLFWFDDAGFERTLGALTRVYRFHQDASGGTEHQAGLGLFSYRDLPAVPGRPAYSRLSLLFGLFQYRNLGGEHGLRLLWLLPEITWGQRREADS